MDGQGESLTFKYEEDRWGPTAINRDVLRNLDALFRRSITLDPEVSKATAERPLYSWTVNFSNKITATAQTIDYLLSLSEPEFANIERVLLNTTSTARESARVLILVRSHQRWEVSFESPVGVDPVVTFKEAFQGIAVELQPPPALKRPDDEHFDDEYSGLVLVSPEALRRLDALFLKSLSWNPTESARDESVRLLSWNVVFSNNRKIYTKSIEEVIALQNSRSEEIVMLHASSAYGTLQKIRFSLRATGLRQGEWNIAFDGTPDELTVFVSEFGRASTSLAARGASLRHPAAPFIAAGAASVFVAALLAAGVPSDRFSSSDKVVLVGGLTALLYIPLSFATDKLWKALFPGFVCIIGDGETRENDRKGLRTWVIGIATTLALGWIASLFALPPPARPVPPPSVPDMNEGSPEPSPDLAQEPPIAAPADANETSSEPDN